MQGIYEANDQFDFSKLVLSKPVAMTGGNYFIRFSYLENPLYIQPPKSTTKQGILKAGKRHFSDLMFSNEHEQYTHWMENLETHCQGKIFENRQQWFDGDMELHDIENYFTPPLKSYKSGKYYLVRVNISSVLGKPVLKIYDENEKDVDMESIHDKTNIMTILEIQGVKCSAKSFQIEIELKQMMVLKPTNLFEKCLLRAGSATTKDLEETVVPLEKEKIPERQVAQTIPIPKEEEVHTKEKKNIEYVIEDKKPVVAEESKTDTLEEIFPKSQNEIEEIEFDLDELTQEDTIQIKKRKDVYYEIYKQAVKKAKMAREMAVSAYLEAKQIKNTYMIQDINDSDESDLEDDDFEFSELKKET